MFTHITQSPYETVKLAGKVAQRIREGTIVCLEGKEKLYLYRVWRGL